MVEVDSSDTGVGEVLSQWTPSDQKLHPCTIFSWRLSPAERMYDVGNRELLAVILALQEWRHWPEGAVHPFLVWTDHWNAKWLNSRQALWVLFLGRFHYTPPTVQAPGTPSPMCSLASSSSQMRKAQMSPSCLPVCGLLQPGGTLSGLSRQRSTLSPPWVTACLSQTPAVPRCSSRSIHLSQHVTQVFRGPYFLSDSVFGGPHRTPTIRSLSLPAPSAPTVKPPIMHLPNYSNPCLFPTDPDHTSPWTVTPHKLFSKMSAIHSTG